MPVARAYFDESGSHGGSPVLCVAGYLIEESNIEAFEHGWRRELEKWGLRCFHMVDCAHGNGEFSHLGKDERVDVETRLIDLIKTHTSRGIGAMVVASLYERLMPHHPNLGSAYNYCLWHCLEGTRLWLAEQSKPATVEYFFESGHASRREADRILALAFQRASSGSNAFGYVQHRFVDKESCAGVQAADLLAWQMYTDWRHGMEGRPRRKDFESLISDKKHRVCVIDEDRILHHVEKMTEQGAWTHVQ